MKNFEIKESEKYLLSLLKEEINENVKIRLEALLCKKQNPRWSMTKIANTLNANRRTIERWLNLYEEGGIKKMNEVQRKGSRLRKLLNHEQQGNLKVAIAEAKVKSYQEARTWILVNCEIRLPYKNVVMFVLKQMGVNLANRPYYQKRSENNLIGQYIG